MADHARTTRPAPPRPAPEPGRPPASTLADHLNASPAVAALSTTADRLNAPVQRPSVQRKANATGLPDSLKAGVESLSGLSLDDVRVHRNSSRPAPLQAHAFAQGTDIHLAPGQEQHLPHEAWHVVQQKQGRVRATAQLKGVNLNDDAALEVEADRMGARAARAAAEGPGAATGHAGATRTARSSPIVQGVFVIDGKPQSKKQFEAAQDDWQAGDLDPIHRKAAVKLMEQWHKTGDHPYASWQEAFAAVVVAAKPAPLTPEAQGCLDAVDNDSPKALMPALRAHFGQDHRMLEHLADVMMRDLTSAMKKRLRDESSIMTAFREIAWVHFGKFYGTGKSAEGMASAVEAIDGFNVHFIGTTTLHDVGVVREAIGRVTKAMKEVTPEGLLKAAGAQDALMAATLKLKDTSTGKKVDRNNAKIAAKASGSVTEEQLLAYAARVITRWRAAANGKITVLIQRAGIETVYGRSSNTNNAPVDVMRPGSSGGEEEKGSGAVAEVGLDVPQRVDINMDTMSPDLVAATFAHEVAHLLGFNPAGMEDNGHMADNADYAEPETFEQAVLGPKMLFDAYYFELIVARLLAG